MKRLSVKEIARHARNCKGAKGIEFGNNGSCVAFATYINGVHCKLALYDAASTYVVDSAEVSVENKNHKGRAPKDHRGGIPIIRVVRYCTEASRE